jgi:tRNA (mo5U34)-methyltransferase
MTREERQALADAIPQWWHSIDLGEGAVSRGKKTPEFHEAELRDLRLPDLKGKTVLDIGAWDGFYSFHAEAQGAARVVALDWFTWVGEPGRRGFDLAHRLRESRVEPVVGDFMTMDLETLGAFDVVLFLGVLYHLEDPLGALRRLRQVTRELAVIETHAIVTPGLEHRPMWEQYPGEELNADPSNWWGPNARAVLDACRVAGFGSAEVVHVRDDLRDAGDGLAYYRLAVHARPGKDEEPATAPPTGGLAALSDELATTRDERDALREELAVVKKSRSWRLTKPLRSLAARVRGR